MKKKTNAKRLAKKSTPKSADQEVVLNVGPTAKEPPTRFFDGGDTEADDLVLPAVYREKAGSHTTILIYVGRTRCQHIPMDSAGLVVVKTDAHDFRRSWVKTGYDPKRAAKKYLDAVGFFISINSTARAALTSVAAGGDADTIIKAVSKVKTEEKLPNGSGIAGDLIKAAKKSAGKRNSNLPKGRGIGTWVCEQIIAKTDDAKILKDVLKKFPGAKTNTSHLNWYRNKLKREGVIT